MHLPSSSEQHVPLVPFYIKLLYYYILFSNLVYRFTDRCELAPLWSRQQELNIIDITKVDFMAEQLDRIVLDCTGEPNKVATYTYLFYSLNAQTHSYLLHNCIHTWLTLTILVCLWLLAVSSYVSVRVEDKAVNNCYDIYTYTLQWTTPNTSILTQFMLEPQPRDRQNKKTRTSSLQGSYTTPGSRPP